MSTKVVGRMRNWKIIFIIAVLAVLTPIYMLKTPAMHKPFQMNIIEYIFNFNDDGSITTTKSTTTTIMNEGEQIND